MPLSNRSRRVPGQHTFTGNASDSWNNDMENKDAVLFGSELSAAYLDGYLGVK